MAVPGPDMTGGAVGAGVRRFTFRTDIEGFRGLGMLLVIAYHADVPRVTGGYVGLDLFFVMSGFLITGLLLNEVDRTGTVSLRGFFARRIRRLLPALTLMLAFVAIAAQWIVAPTSRSQVAGDVFASNLYYVNWRFASQSVDYMMNGAAASPIQHCWSLSVEEQFYLVWPVVLVGAIAWHRWRRGRSVRMAALPPIAAIFAASLAYSIVMTPRLGHAAYFSTFTRVWEFALGALVALIPLTRTPFPAWLANLVIAAGLAVYAWTAVAYDAFTFYPGVAALAPALAAAALMLAGMNRTTTLGYRFLSLRPLRFCGRISYSWYLWHWPLVVYATLIWGDLTYQQKLGVMAVSLVPTLLSHHLVEEPMRRSTWFARRHRRNFTFAAGSTLALAGCAALLAVLTPTVPLAAASEVSGAAALNATSGIQTSARALRPTPRTATRDAGQAKADGCLVSLLATRSGPCVYGDRTSSTTVVLFGASHAGQWFPALDVIAKRRGWRLVVLTKGSCSVADLTMYNRQLRRIYRECSSWRAASLKRIAGLRPAAIFVTGPADFVPTLQGRRITDPQTSLRVLEAGYVRTFRRLAATGARVLVLGETPRPKRDPLTCASANLTRLARCAFTVREAYAVRPVELLAARRVRGARGIPVRSAFCARGTCPVVVGNALVYRNTSHITATYMVTLVPWLERRLPARLTSAG